MAGATLPPGIGNPEQAQQATWFLRNQPWYQQWLQQNRIPLQTDAYGDVKLTDAQQQDLLNVARQHGIGISDSYEVNQNGQITNVPSHVLRNILIGAGIGGAALTGFGLAGVGPLAGALGGSAEAAGAGGAAGLGGVEAGATAGLGSAALPGAMATLPAVSAGSAGAGLATAAASGLPDWLSAAKDVGGALSSLSAGQATGRNLDNQANIGYANAQNSLYNSELAAPGKVAGNAVRGDILSNAKDVSLSAPSDIPVPQISGGLRPSMFSDTTRQLGKNITANAAATPLPTPTPPTLQPMETAGLGSDLLNGASTVANLVGPAWKIGQSIPWGKLFG